MQWPCTWPACPVTIDQSQQHLHAQTPVLYKLARVDDTDPLATLAEHFICDDKNQVTYSMALEQPGAADAYGPILPIASAERDRYRATDTQA